MMITPGACQADHRSAHSWLKITVALGLFGASLALYCRAVGHDFVYFDDTLYVQENERVMGGVTWENLRWAAGARVAANWHPITLVSLMLDRHLFGPGPWGFHFTNILLHAVNTAVLFLVLERMTGRFWPSALVAALFGWHPTHVESVAWISERKDVLSALFGLAALGAYGAYARRTTWWRYALVFVLLALGLSAKPMLVTWPFVLLLLDYWPLGRLARNVAGAKAAGRAPAIRLVIEKIPLVALAAASCVVTLVVQRQEGAVTPLTALPLERRLLNAVVSYYTYVAKTIWPAGLAMPYPYAKESDRLLPVVVGSVALLLVTVAVIATARRRPYLLVGWLWFLGTLVPVIGLIQVGQQALADRYLYLPSIGLFIMIAWTVADWASARPIRAGFATVASLVWLGVLAAVTWRQIGHWRDTGTLAERAIAVTQDNYLAHEALAMFHYEQAKYDQAIREFDKALSIRFDASRPHFYKAAALLELQKEPERAYYHLSHAQRLGHDAARTTTKMARALVQLRRYDQARRRYLEALKLQPNLGEAILGLGDLYARMGRADEARRIFAAAAARARNQPEMQSRLAWIYATHPLAEIRDAKRAVELAEKACRATRYADPEMRDTLAAAQAEAGRFDEAVATARQALRRLTQSRAASARQDQLAADIRARIALYQAHKAYRDPTFGTP